MSCASCSNCETIATCVDTIVVGDAPAISTAYYVYFQRISNGRIEKIDCTSGTDKKLSVDVSGLNFASDEFYEVWITKTTGESVNSRETITISGETVKCLFVDFKKALSYTTQILSLV